MVSARDLASTEGARSSLVSAGVRQSRSVYRRRQATALGGLLGFVLLLVLVLRGCGGGDDPS